MVSIKLGIQEIALKAGVSTSTVSRVLNGGSVSADARKRVERVMEQSGYRPNLMARRLRSQQTNVIGLIVPDIRTTFFTSVIRRIEREALAADMRVFLCNTDEDPEREMLFLKLMEEERVSGLIFAPTLTTLKRLPKLSFGYPVTLVDRADAKVPFDSVSLDNRGGMTMLVEHLLDRGYRSLCAFFGNASNTDNERLEGYAAALRARGLGVDTRKMAPNAEAAYAQGMEMLASGARPQAFVAGNGPLLLGLFRSIRDSGLRIPVDIALVGFDNEVWTDLTEPGITVIEQPAEEIGRQAFSCLLARMKAPKLPITKIVLSGNCLVRSSSTEQLKHAR